MTSGNTLRMADGGWRIRHWGQPLPVLLMLGLLTGPGLGAAGPAGGNPIGPGTVPPSTYESQLVNTPSPVDTSSNQVMTGNVSGGKHFRGRVPYNATTSFAAPLGSTSMDSFLRYTAIPDELQEYSPGYSPFYSPTGTVTTMQPGYRGAVAAPLGPRMSGAPSWRAEQPTDVMALADLPPARPRLGDTSSPLDLATGTLPPAAGAVAPTLPSWPAHKTPEELRRLIQGEASHPPTSPPPLLQSTPLLAPGDYQQQLEQLRRDIERIRTSASELEQGLKTKDSSAATALERKPVEAVESSNPAEVSGTRAPSQPQPRTRPAAEILNSDRGTWSSIPSVADLSRLPGVGQEQMGGAQMDGSAASGLPPYDLATGAPGSLPAPAGTLDRIDAIFATQGPSGPAAGSPTVELPAVQRVKQTTRAFDATSKFLEQPPKATPSAAPGAASRLPTPPDPLALPPQLQGGGPGNETKTPPAPAQQLIGDRLVQKYATPNPPTSSQDKFERYLKAAEAYLQQGQYGSAAKAFTLASHYRPNEARAYLGKSHALLGASEYLNSAISLAQAIELDSRVALAQADLVETLGGPEAFVTRISGLEYCAKTNNEPQLQFLLAYVYRQMNQPAEAQAALEAAAKALPASLALDLLKAAIGGKGPGS